VPGDPKVIDATRAAYIAGIVAAASLAVGANAAQVVESFGGWTLYRDTGAKICFLAAKPAASAPPGANRDSPLLYVSSWTGSGVKAEISVRLGFPAKKGLEPIITVSNRAADQPSTVYRMFTKDDRAFVSDSTQELKLLEAMKKGSKLVVESTSERGTSITDTYALNGITAGLVALAGACN